MSNDLALIAGLAGVGIAGYIAYQKGYLKSLGLTPKDTTGGTTGGGGGTTTNGGTTNVTEDYYSLTINVMDNDGNSVPNANVTFDNLSAIKTDTDGKVKINNVTSGTHTIGIEKTGYDSVSSDYDIEGDRTIDATLHKKTNDNNESDGGGDNTGDGETDSGETEHYYTATVDVVGDNGNPVPNANVRVGELSTHKTNANGRAIFEGISLGRYTIDVAKRGWVSDSSRHNITSDSVIDITLQPQSDGGGGGGDDGNVFTREVGDDVL